MLKTLLIVLMTFVLAACVGPSTLTPATIDNPEDFDFQNASTEPPGIPTDELVLARNVIEDEAGDVDDPMLDVLSFMATLKTQRRIEVIIEVRDLPAPGDPEYAIGTLNNPAYDDLPPAQLQISYLPWPPGPNPQAGKYANVVTFDAEANTIQMRSRVPGLDADSVVLFVTYAGEEVADTPPGVTVTVEE